MTYQAILDSGHKVLDMNRYFGETDQKIYEVYKDAVRFATEVESRLNSIKYRGVPLVTGLKVRLLENATFMAKIRSLLENKRDVVFLFAELEHYHFVVPTIAMNEGYDSDGIARVKDGQADKLEFGGALANYHKKIYERVEGMRSSEETGQDSDRIHAFLDSLALNKEWAGTCAFFLLDNEEGYYLKPVYPVIERFKVENTKAALFSFSTYTVRQVVAAGHKCHDLDVKVGELESMMLHDNAKIIVDFLVLAKSMSPNSIMGSYILSLVNDSVVRHISRILAIIAITGTILDKFQHKTVIIATDGNPDNHVACGVADNKGVTTFSIAPVVKQFHAIFGYLYMASRILVSGPRQKRELEKLGIATHRIVVTGSPRYDYIAQTRDTKPRKGRTNVLVAMSRLHDRDEQWMSQLIRYCDQEGLSSYIKLHPTFQYREDLRVAAENMIKAISEQCSGLKFEVSYDADLKVLLANATIFITDYSSVALEASLHGLPIITFSPSGEPYEDPNAVDFHKEGIALQALSTGELFGHISALIKEDGPAGHAKRFLHLNPTQRHLRQARDNFNYEFNYMNDGKAAERIFHLLADSKND